jgi:hypothetical protein
MDVFGGESSAFVVKASKGGRILVVMKRAVNNSVNTLAK